MKQINKLIKKWRSNTGFSRGNSWGSRRFRELSEINVAKEKNKVASKTTARRLQQTYPSNSKKYSVLCTGCDIFHLTSAMRPNKNHQTVDACVGKPWLYGCGGPSVDGQRPNVPSLGVLRVPPGAAFAGPAWQLEQAGPWCSCTDLITNQHDKDMIPILLKCKKQYIYKSSISHHF